MTTKKKILLSLSAVLLLALALGAIFLYERSRVAMIIDDEAAWDVRDSLSNATRMKVIILSDGAVARYAGEDENTYTGEIQDTFSIPKEGSKVETWSASAGQGVVYMKNPGMVQVLYEPGPTAGVKCDIIYEEGMCPDTYRCLGLNDGWYEISLGEGGSGFVQARLMNWDAIDTF